MFFFFFFRHARLIRNLLRVALMIELSEKKKGLLKSVRVF